MRRMTPQKTNVLFSVLLVIGAAIAFWGVFCNIVAAEIVGILVMFGAVVFRFIFYKCPHCGKYLDRSAGDFCPYCGQRVNR